MINVTKTYLPPFDEYINILKGAWEKGWITNNGYLVQELENKLKTYLKVDYLLFCNNGTTVLQMALKAFNITKEVITTPFSYVATCNAILWEKCQPVFVDIDPDTFCIDTNKIEAAITEDTQAILPTHVYGLPCNIEKIEKIAEKYKLKVIYDGAHAFGSVYKQKSLLSYGDISTCSFHATKIFHTVEGGCIVCKDEEIYKKLFLYRQFGHIYEDYIEIGINGKNSEFHAAMGLSLFPYIEKIIQYRKNLSELYDRLLFSIVSKPVYKCPEFTPNFAYYPVVFGSEKKLLFCKSMLEVNGVGTRRYFFPSLNELSYVKSFSCPISEDTSRRVLCLPLYPDLTEDEVETISKIIIGTLGEV